MFDLEELSRNTSIREIFSRIEVVWVEYMLIELTICPVQNHVLNHKQSKTSYQR